jgi:hypothetical protein
MTQIKPDKIIFSSSIDTYLNYLTSTANLVLSGNVANGATANFTAIIPYTRGKTRADIYARNTTTGIKKSLSQGGRINPYTFKSSETSAHSVTYSSNRITVVVSIFNGSGANITLTTQTWEISAVFYEVPYVQ